MGKEGPRQAYTPNAAIAALKRVREQVNVEAPPCPGSSPKCDPQRLMTVLLLAEDGVSLPHRGGNLLRSLSLPCVPMSLLSICRARASRTTRGG
jgi:hypothetical protein